MKLSQLKSKLSQLDTIGFQLPDGSLVPSHFHVTEVGRVTKDFIDCGGTLRKEEVVNLQLWDSVDYDHRLHPEKLVHILELSERKLGIVDSDIEVEYQGESIQKFGLDFDGKYFQLVTKQTDCLAKSDCGIPAGTTKNSEEVSCAPGSGCC